MTDGEPRLKALPPDQPAAEPAAQTSAPASAVESLPFISTMVLAWLYAIIAAGCLVGLADNQLLLDGVGTPSLGWMVWWLFTGLVSATLAITSTVAYQVAAQSRTRG